VGVLEQQIKDWLVVKGAELPTVELVVVVVQVKLGKKV
jgi:hypothetical protein